MQYPRTRHSRIRDVTMVPGRWKRNVAPLNPSAKLATICTTKWPTCPGKMREKSKLFGAWKLGRVWQPG